MLFFGCRHKSKDFIYSKELESLRKKNALSHLVVAFSRDDPKKKVYVQDKMDEMGLTLWEMIHDRVKRNAFLSLHQVASLGSVLLYLWRCYHGKSSP